LRVLELVVAGGLLAATAWTRPAFAAYAVAPLVWLELVSGSRTSRRALILDLAAALVSAIGIAILFFPTLEPATLIEATVLAPARLMTLGKRTLLPDFARSGVVLTLLVGGAIAAAPIAWAWSVPSRRGRLLSAAAIGLGAALPLGLQPRTPRLTVVLIWCPLAARPVSPSPSRGFAAPGSGRPPGSDSRPRRSGTT
jgi:hypothetical protein